MEDLLKKLDLIQVRFEEVSTLITDPDIIGDMTRYVKLNKEYKDLEEIVTCYKDYVNVVSNIKNAKELLATEKDPEYREMAEMELDELGPKKDALEEQILVDSKRPRRRQKRYS